VGINNLPFKSMIVGGATSRGGMNAQSGAGRMIAGLDEPEGHITGNVGDIFQSLNGTSGKVLWVKETGNGNDTGWVAK